LAHMARELLNRIAALASSRRHDQPPGSPGL
jgi:hypothetical protein